MKIGYSDFVTLLRVNDPQDLGAGYVLEKDGVYVAEPPPDTPALERAVLTEHPDKDLTKPVLSFPCTLKELQHFAENNGLYGCIDAFDMAEWVMRAPNKTSPKDFSANERNTMLKLIYGMAKDAYGYDTDSNRNSSTGDKKNGISPRLAALNIGIHPDTIRKYLKAGKDLL